MKMIRKDLGGSSWLNRLGVFFNPPTIFTIVLINGLYSVGHILLYSKDMIYNPFVV